MDFSEFKGSVFVWYRLDNEPRVDGDHTNTHTQLSGVAIKKNKPYITMGPKLDIKLFR